MRILFGLPIPPRQRRGERANFRGNDGRLHWGLDADWDVLPDLRDLVAAIHASFDELLCAQGIPRAIANTDIAMCFRFNATAASIQTCARTTRRNESSRDWYSSILVGQL